MRGSLWPAKGYHLEDLYDRRILVCRNTRPVKRVAQAEYIWRIEDYDTHKLIAIATEVPLVGAPLGCVPGFNPAVVGHLPPGQLVLKDAHPVSIREWARVRPHAVILTSDGEIWTATGRRPPVNYRAPKGDS